MKTIFTLLASALVTVSSFSAPKTATVYQPSVVINAPSDFEVAVDGRIIQDNNGYNNSNNFVLRNMARGQHSITVYEMRNGLFGKSRRQVSNSSFYVDYNDIYINVDRNGYANVQQRNSGYDNNSGYGNNGYGNRNDRGNVYNNGNGKGYGYGRNKHCDDEDNGRYDNRKYKNRKDRKHEDDNEDDDDYRRNDNNRWRDNQ